MNIWIYFNVLIHFDQLTKLKDYTIGSSDHNYAVIIMHCIESFRDTTF